MTNPDAPAIPSYDSRARRGPETALVLHGLTGTPDEVLPLARALGSHGYSTSAPRLAGHESRQALVRSAWRHWYQSAETAFLELASRGAGGIVVVGFSMGGLLALRLAALYPRLVSGVVCMSVPLAFDSWKRSVIFGIARLRQSLRLERARPLVHPTTARPQRTKHRAARFQPVGFPFPALAQLIALQDDVHERLLRIEAPVLIMHGRLDRAVPPSQSERLARSLASPRVELVILPRSAHVVALDLDQAQLCDEVVRFVGSLAPPNARGA